VLSQAGTSLALRETQAEQTTTGAVIGAVLITALAADVVTPQELDKLAKTQQFVFFGVHPDDLEGRLGGPIIELAKRRAKIGLGILTTGTGITSEGRELGVRSEDIRTIRKLDTKAKITLAMKTAERRKEAVLGAKIMGVTEKSIRFFRFGRGDSRIEDLDQTLKSKVPEIVEYLKAQIANDNRPLTIMLHDERGDPHPAHVAARKMFLSAIQKFSNKTGNEVEVWIGMLPADDSTINKRLPITQITYLTILEAFNAHRTQTIRQNAELPIKQQTENPNWIPTLQRMLAMQKITGEEQADFGIDTQYVMRFQQITIKPVSDAVEHFQVSKTGSKVQKSNTLASANGYLDTKTILSQQFVTNIEIDRIIETLSRMKSTEEVTVYLNEILTDSRGPEIAMSVISRLGTVASKKLFEQNLAQDFVDAYGTQAIDFAQLEHLSILSRLLSLALSSDNSNKFALFLFGLKSDTDIHILPSVRILIDSALSIYNLKEPKTVTLVIPDYGSQYIAEPINNHFVGQGFINIKLREMEDLRRINNKLSFRIIFVCEGDDSLAATKKFKGRTTHNVLNEIINKNPSLKEKTASGQLVLLDFGEDLKNAVKSIKGGGQIYAMHKALSYPDTDIILTTDAPCEVPLSQAGVLITAASVNPDKVVIGSRRHPLSAVQRTFKRKFLSSVLEKITNLFLPELRNLSDKQMGYKVWPRSIAEKVLPPVYQNNGQIFYDGNFDYGRTFDTNLLARVAIIGYGIIEEPSIVISSRSVTYGLRGNLYFLEALPKHSKDRSIFKKRFFENIENENKARIDNWVSYANDLMNNKDTIVKDSSWQSIVYMGTNAVIKKPNTWKDIFTILVKKFKNVKTPPGLEFKKQKIVTAKDYATLALWKIFTFHKTNSAQFKEARQLATRIGGLALPCGHVLINGRYHMIQKKDVALFDYFFPSAFNIKKPNSDEVCNLVKQAVDMMMSLWKLGVFLDDFQFPQNFAIEDGHIYLADLGRLSSKKPILPLSFYRKIWRLWVWEGICKEYPDAFDLYEKLANQYFTKENLDKWWNSEKGYPVSNLTLEFPSKNDDKFYSPSIHNNKTQLTLIQPIRVIATSAKNRIRLKQKNKKDKNTVFVPHKENITFFTEMLKIMRETAKVWNKKELSVGEKDVTMVLMDGGKGMRMRKSLPAGAIDNFSSKGDICVMGSRVRDIGVKQMRYVLPFLPKGRWFVIKTSDEVFMPTENDIQHIKEDFESQPGRGIYIIGWRNWHKKEKILVNFAGKILSMAYHSRVPAVRSAAKKIFDASTYFLKRIRSIDKKHPYLVIISEDMLPYFENLYSENSGNSIFDKDAVLDTDNLYLKVLRPAIIGYDWMWDMLYEKNGDHSREQWDYLLRAGKVLSNASNDIGVIQYNGAWFNLNTANDLSSLYKALLPGESFYEARRNLYEDIGILDKDEVINSHISDQIRFSGFHLIYDSKIKSDPGVIINAGSGTIMDRCRLCFHGEPGTIINIPTGTVFVGVNDDITAENVLNKKCRLDKVVETVPTIANANGSESNHSLNRLKELRKNVTFKIMHNNPMRIDFGSLEQDIYELADYLRDEKFSKIAEQILRDISSKIPIPQPIAKIGDLEIHVATLPMIICYLDDLAEGFTRETKGFLEPTSKEELVRQLVYVAINDTPAKFDLRDRYHGYGFLALDPEKHIVGYYQASPEKIIKNIHNDGQIDYYPVTTHYGQKIYLDSRFYRGQRAPILLGEFLFYLSIRMAEFDGLTWGKAKTSSKPGNENVISWHRKRYQDVIRVDDFMLCSGEIKYALTQCEHRIKGLHREEVATEALLNLAIRRAYSNLINNNSNQKLLELVPKTFDNLIYEKLNKNLTSGRTKEQIIDAIAVFRQIETAYVQNKPSAYISQQENDKNLDELWQNFTSQASNMNLYFLDRNIFFETNEVFSAFKTKQIGNNVSEYLKKLGVLCLFFNREGIKGKGHEKAAEDLYKSLMRAAQRDYVDEFANILVQLKQFGCQPFTFSLQQRLLSDKIAKSEKKTVTVAIHQPGYLRYKGFYNKMAGSDIFILYDCVQYVDREWQNRGLIFKSYDPIENKEEVEWLSVPLKKGHQTDIISEKRIAWQENWQSAHLNKIKRVYSSSPYFEQHRRFLKVFYSMPWNSMSEMEEALIRYEAKQLGIDVPIIRSSMLDINAGSKKGERLSLVIQKTLGKKIIEDSNVNKIYLSGKGALEYMNAPAPNGKLQRDYLLETGINIAYQEFTPPRYIRTQMPGEIVHPGTTTLDLIFNMGPNAKNLISKPEIHLTQAHASGLGNSDIVAIRSNAVDTAITDGLGIMSTAETTTITTPITPTTVTTAVPTQAKALGEAALVIGPDDATRMDMAVKLQTSGRYATVITATDEADAVGQIREIEDQYTVGLVVDYTGSEVNLVDAIAKAIGSAEIPGIKTRAPEEIDAYLQSV